MRKKIFPNWWPLREGSFEFLEGLKERPDFRAEFHSGSATLHCMTLDVVHHLSWPQCRIYKIKWDNVYKVCSLIHSRCLVSRFVPSPFPTSTHFIQHSNLPRTSLFLPIVYVNYPFILHKHCTMLATDPYFTDEKTEALRGEINTTQL